MTPDSSEMIFGGKHQELSLKLIICFFFFLFKLKCGERLGFCNLEIHRLSLDKNVASVGNGQCHVIVS